ncbi:MAG TPA: BON domain-containing protein [Arenicellales bacterium]|jgi:osmotically-inducible protein OsmY|nr:BON domain-containing protein [Arenicellales bacterium]MDP7220677.1 BON domain-containing protein [Arenicellales bacterium]HJP09894.1 BON domain-containing protein [Arenicellales bacterium]|tara:strand:- start:99 stop:695 length:597 start_codon:yes stop_codon:yes gene_type:complete
MTDLIRRFSGSVLIPVLLVTVVLSTGGCGIALVTAATVLTIDVVRDRREARTYWDDNKAEVDIRRAVAKDKDIDDENVSVTIWNGVVLLTGEVPSQRNIDTILDIAKSHNHTRQVINRIELAGRTNMTSRANDSWLTARVKTAVAASGTLDATKLKIVTERANVYLMGLVTRAEAAAAVDIVRTVPGVVRVIKVFEYI